MECLHRVGSGVGMQGCPVGSETQQRGLIVSLYWSRIIVVGGEWQETGDLLTAIGEGLVSCCSASKPCCMLKLNAFTVRCF